MSIPPIDTDVIRFLKRPRFPPVEEDEHEEEEDDDEDYNTAIIDGEEEEDDDEDDEEEEEIGEEENEDVEINDDVGGTRMATIGNDSEDVITEAQSRRSVSSSPSGSSSQQSVKLKCSEVLDCPTCCEPLKKPIYQCTNGHIACSSCCKKLKRKCPFCRSHIGDIRCRAMEKVLEASIVPCRNAVYGCRETISYGDQSSHEKRCVFIRCTCPLSHCNYTGSYSDLKQHARSSHSWDAENLIPFVFDAPQIFSMNLCKRKMTVFQEEKEGDLVVVQALKGSHGVYMTVSCIAPMAREVHELSCSLAKLNAYTTLKLGLMVKKIQKVEEQQEPKDDFMLIPSYMLSGDHMKMQICIGSEFKYVHI
ncbi:unnamed protein product [Thlaspi arvense]|uniref:RING-type E3 ubiquitin transferase n=1 Tax=Thlaspi arvense TaxID=13288 RepID=A0AAU9SGN9_THLAR|nr:unnamed protein product [Thlaspi arvense]